MKQRQRKESDASLLSLRRQQNVKCSSYLTFKISFTHLLLIGTILLISTFIHFIFPSKTLSQQISVLIK